MSGDEDCSSLLREVEQQVVEPTYSFGIQAIGRFVQHEGMRVPE